MWDSRKGPGIFYHLDHLRKGDVITVGRADRSALRFVVTQVMKVSKRAFPTALVYVGTRSPSLRLISCGGDFDRASGHYLSNIVVLAVPGEGNGGQEADREGTGGQEATAGQEADDEATGGHEVEGEATRGQHVSGLAASLSTAS